ncbi:MAG: hypothetical protein NT113_22870 [Hyphomicrobiales bacterium]|nr:hypothetical protein [Hyphomicrobiales bacterium]
MSELIVMMFVVWIWFMTAFCWFCPRIFGGWLADVAIAYRKVMERQP